MDRVQLALDLMERHGDLGIKWWKSKVKQSHRNEIARRLGCKIAEQIHDVRLTIGSSYSENTRSELRFIPMVTNASGIEYAFFLPIREHGSNGISRLSFDLYLVVDDVNSLGFRWEPADTEDSRHCYGHVQMCKKLIRKNIEPSGIPSWIPDSFPAIPISTTDPLQMFLSLTTSVHGFGGGLLSELRAMFPEATVSSLYIRELESYLAVDTTQSLDQNPI